MEEEEEDSVDPQDVGKKKCFYYYFLTDNFTCEVHSLYQGVKPANTRLIQV